MTRFNEVLPLWNIFKSIWEIKLFTVWHNFEHTLVIFHAIGLIIIVVNGQIMTNILALWSH